MKISRSFLKLKLFGFSDSYLSLPGGHFRPLVAVESLEVVDYDGDGDRHDEDTRDGTETSNTLRDEREHQLLNYNRRPLTDLPRHGGWLHVTVAHCRHRDHGPPETVRDRVEGRVLLKHLKIKFSQNKFKFYFLVRFNVIDKAGKEQSSNAD